MKKKPIAPAAPQTNANILLVPTIDGKTHQQVCADLATEGVLTNALLLMTFGKNMVGEVQLTETVQSLRATIAGVGRSELGASEALLMSQAIALNAVFAECARRSSVNMGEHMDATDRYMRLALKAQGQCRATLETLAAIKNPPVVFARQANINNGGQQQVNNVPAPNGPPASAHAGEIVSAPNELSKDLTHGCTQLDTRATAGAGRADQDLEPLDAINRPAQP